MPTSRQSATGERGEELACRELSRRGYAILARRYRTRLGEIDIVAMDGDVLIRAVQHRERWRSGSCGSETDGGGRLVDPTYKVVPKPVRGELTPDLARQGESQQLAGVTRAADRHHQVLLAIEHIGHRRSGLWGRHVDGPDLVAGGLGILLESQRHG